MEDGEVLAQLRRFTKERLRETKPGTTEHSFCVWLSEQCSSAEDPFEVTADFRLPLATLFKVSERLKADLQNKFLRCPMRHRLLKWRCILWETAGDVPRDRFRSCVEAIERVCAVLAESASAGKSAPERAPSPAREPAPDAAPRKRKRAKPAAPPIKEPPPRQELITGGRSRPPATPRKKKNRREPEASTAATAPNDDPKNSWRIDDGPWQVDDEHLFLLQKTQRPVFVLSRSPLDLKLVTETVCPAAVCWEQRG